MVDQREAAIVTVRLAELARRPVVGRFDVTHLNEIHRRIFQDLPHHLPGMYRPKASAHIKGRVLEVSGHRYHIRYALRDEVDSGLREILTELNGAEHLRGLNEEAFAIRMAVLYADLDFLHPFKEGNSRTLRIFTAQLAHEVGRTLNWHATNVDAASHDRFYIARDMDVLRRAYPDLRAAPDRRVISEENDARCEAWTTLECFRQADTLATIIRESLAPVVVTCRG